MSFGHVSPPSVVSGTVTRASRVNVFHVCAAVLLCYLRESLLDILQGTSSMLFPVVEIHRVVCSFRVLAYIHSSCDVLACGGLVCFPVTCATVPPCVVIRDVRAIVAHLDPVFFPLWNRVEGIVQDFHDIVLDLSSKLLCVIRGVEVGCSRVYSRQGVDTFLSSFSWHVVSC